MPAGSIFTGKGPAAFDAEDDSAHLLAMCAVMNSRAFAALVATRLNATDAQARSFEVGTIQLTPFPELDPESLSVLSELALKQWRIRQRMDQAIETSHAFVLPAVLLRRVRPDYQADCSDELNRLQDDIDQAAYRAYGVGPEDCAEGPMGAMPPEAALTLPADEEDEADSALALSSEGDEPLMSWAVGVAFGRFDWRLALGERAVPADPEPLDPLPAKSPGMLPEGVVPLFPSAAVMVDDPGHAHDLARAVEEVVATVGLSAPDNVRRWLQREFFTFHLQRYSKSRRKAPIYWPLSTASGTYTLWVYYPNLTNQTLYTAVNDFLDGPSGKLKEVGGVLAKLRNKGSTRTRDDEGQFEAMQAFELELLELRDSLLRLAPTYKPSHDDGVQICAAPLWTLFRHKPWQKLLKDTWTKFEKGEYDWAHMAMNYWPDRVREKCKTDKSLAIVHGLESLYVAPEVAPKKRRGRTKGAEE